MLPIELPRDSSEVVSLHIVNAACPAPAELAGQRIGVRSYTQTTGMWVRAHLTADYGLSTQSMRWFTRDPAHVEEYRDPPFVEHLPTHKSLPDLLRDGDIDAAILGNDCHEATNSPPSFPMPPQGT